MLICYDQRNGSGCNALNPDNAPKCQKCGRNLQFALHLHDPNSVIGHYQIIQVIGRGGFGAVYEAKDTRSGAIVALKESFDAESVRGFQREFDILSRLQHHNLTGYYEMFEAEGNGYLIMEFIAGQSLWEIFQKQRAPLMEAQVLGYAMQLCEVLSYLHSQPKPIIHRDIKPANVRLTPEGLVKLVDFGLVKRGVGHTATSMPGLCPYYAPIEQWGNLHGHTDARSDIYSLAATLYHLLAGQPPMPATHRVASQQDSLISPQQHNPKLSPQVSAAIMQALQLPKEKRYDTVLQFRQALLERSASQPVSPSASQRSAGQAASFTSQPMVLGGSASVGQRAASQPSFSWLWVGVVGILGMASLLLIVMISVFNLTTSTPKPPTQNSNSDMVRIPVGEFTMGSDKSDDEKPIHQVFLAEYFINKYETTNAQYAVCVNAGKCIAPHETKSVTRDSYYGNAQYANYPVINVDWTQAKSYCEFTGKRLPTEAEWEKAARGTDGRTYPWGDEAASCNRLNFNDGTKDCVGDTTEVGSYPSGASPYGVMDMAGNVWEWTSSNYKRYPYIANDGRENLLSNNYKVLRSGSWSYDDTHTRVSYREDDFPMTADGHVGFRCAQ